MTVNARRALTVRAPPAAWRGELLGRARSDADEDVGAPGLWGDIIELDEDEDLVAAVS